MFGNKNKKVIKAIWSVLVVFIIISMVMLYTPIFFGGHSGSPATSQDNVNLPDQTITITEDGLVEEASENTESSMESPQNPAETLPPTPNLDFSPI